MFNTILESMQAGGPSFWLLFTLANTFLVARAGYALFDRYDAWKARQKWETWKRKYDYSVPGAEPRKLETQERMSEFAQGLQALCNQYGLNVTASSGIKVSDRRVQREGYSWHAVFAGCDRRGVYNLINPGWFE